MIEVIEIKHGSAKYVQADGLAIQCEVLFSHMPGEFVPFAATPADPYPHSQAVWAALQNGEAGPIAPYEPPPEVPDDPQD